MSIKNVIKIAVNNEYVESDSNGCYRIVEPYKYDAFE
jgi:hypothetical protein